ISGMPLDDLRDVYDAQEDSDKLARLVRFRTARKSLRDRFLQTLDAMKPGQEDFGLILIGEKDGLAEERKVLDQALRESGLLDVLEVPIPPRSGLDNRD